MSLRLLISASEKNPNTIGAFIINNFDGSFEFERLHYPDVFTALMSKPWNKVIYRIAPTLITRRMDRLFLKQVDEFQPTIILIFKGMEISSWSLKQIKARGIKLVNYNFDHPYDFFSRGTGNSAVRKAIPYYDLHISYSSIIAQELSTRFDVKTACIPFGFHLSDQNFDAVVRENRPEIRRACFVGNPDAIRIDMIDKMLKDGIPIDLYGFGWERIFSGGGLLTIHLPRRAGSYWDDPLEFWKVLRQYRIQLNFFRPHNEGSHNLRTFEVPAVGGVLLTPFSAEQQRFFDPGREIFFYSDYRSLLDQIRMLMKADDGFIGSVRQQARKRSLDADYSYSDRTSQLITLLKSL